MNKNEVNTSEAVVESTMEITDQAVNQIRQIQAKDPNYQNTPLRVRVVGGGCSGMSYKLDFDSEGAKPQDRILEIKGVRIVVDSKSLLFLKGTTLDYSGGLNGKGFEFKNPNAKQTCGCGSSFGV